ncbi:MAG: hypothetical protein ABH871_07545 [Pseudomonadota bacterium]
MKIIFLSVVLLFAAVASAQEAGVGPAMTYIEKGYFTVEIPAGWLKADVAFGLSQEKKKVYGANFLAASDSDGLAPRISVHYYAQGNLLHKTADKFIRTHSEPVLGATDDGRYYSPVKKGLVGKYHAKVFECNTFEYIPPESIDQKKIPVYEKFAVVPAKAGFYVLSLYSPMETSKANLKAYKSVLASFKALVR